MLHQLASALSSIVCPRKSQRACCPLKGALTDEGMPETITTRITSSTPSKQERQAQSGEGSRGEQHEGLGQGRGAGPGNGSRGGQVDASSVSQGLEKGQGPGVGQSLGHRVKQALGR